MGSIIRNYGPMLLLLLPMIVTPALAQELSETTLDSILAEAQQLYYSAKYNSAIAMLEGALDSAPREALPVFHKYLALCYAEMGNKSKTQEHFKQSLRYNAKLKLPPDTPEKIVLLFNETKRELSSEAAMCSCMLPGMGQMLKGETRKGQRIMLACGLTALSAGAAWFVTMNKRSAYLDLGPDDIDRMDAAYGSYNTWYRTSLALTALFACVYIYNYLDASSVQLNNLSAASKSSIFVCRSDGDAARFCLTFRF